MKFQVITLFPKMIEALTNEGVIHQAQQKNLLQIETLNPRDFTSDVHRTVDDRPFGGGDGMVMLAEPLEKAIQKAQAQSEEKPWIVYMTPHGSRLDQGKVEELSARKNLVLICGRYGGIDQRIINQFVNEEISIGDYVLSGGELGAAVVIDAVSRQIPGVLGHADSASSDSFSQKLKGLLEAPSFTRPREILGEATPDILLSGNHKKMEESRQAVSILTTLLKRPDLVFDLQMTDKEKQKIKAFWLSLSPSEKQTWGLSALDTNDLNLL